LQEASYTSQRLKNLLQRCEEHCEKQDRVLLLATIAATKKLRAMIVVGYVTLGNYSGNLTHNKIVRQVAQNIA